MHKASIGSVLRVLQHNLFYIFVHMLKRITLFILLALLVLFASGQGFDQLSAQQNDTSETVTLEEAAEIEQRLSVWKLTNHYGHESYELIDTSTINFHIHHPIFQQSISNNYLGYVGAPYESNLFFQREDGGDFYFMKHLQAYYKEAAETRYFNTTTPYASLMYDQGKQGGRNAEQVFEAFFTRNIDSITNFGFHYDAIKNKSQFNYQEAIHNDFNVFVSRNAERYNSYISFIKRNNNLVLNGGIRDTIIRPSLKPADYAVGLVQPFRSDNKSFTIFTSHEYLMGQIPFLLPDTTMNDSLLAEFVPRYAIQYSVVFDHYKRFNNESTVDVNYFDNTWFSTSNHIDSLRFTKFSHLLQLKMFENENRKFTFGKRVFAENEVVRAAHPLPEGNRTYRYSNLYLGGEIYSRKNDMFQWDATARFALLGRNIGDASVMGSAEKSIHMWGDTTLLTVSGGYRDFSANIFQEHLYSNHFKWDNDFKKQHEVLIRSAFYYPRIHASMGFNYALISNYLYNNTMAIPDQYEGEFSVAAFWLNKEVLFGRFAWSNKMVWQGVSNSSVLRLPQWNFYSSLYYSHYLFKVMKIQLGVEAYYHTRFMANAFEPSTTTFYLQNERETGAYPLINLYANAKLKRTSAFVKYEHANSWYKMGESFSTPGYPIEQRALRFGFLWTFYD